MTPPGTDSCSIHRFFIYMKDEFERLFYPKRKNPRLKNGLLCQVTFI